MKCPECAQGKTVNCATIALDPEADDFVPCETTAHEETQVEAMLRIQAEYEADEAADRLAHPEDYPAPVPSEATEAGEGEQVHWVGEHNNTLHGNGAGSKDMTRTSGDEDEVTCTLCQSLLARADIRERITPAEPDAGEVEALAKVCANDTGATCGCKPFGGICPVLATPDEAALALAFAPTTGAGAGIRYARLVLASDWLAALLDRVRRESEAAGLRAAADEIDRTRSQKGIASRALDPGKAYAVAALRDRADRVAP